MTRFIDLLWKSADDVYHAILKHPFVEGLVSGSLDNSVFKQYIIQDALYLSRFARAVALVAVKAPDDETGLTLLRNAEATLSFERKSLHDFLLAEWGFAPEN
ncbi:MAG: thiaminase II, partial [Candidatus Kryptonium sp.]|nr:thiaminase II [Candidatus Kryptonium sp.]